MPLTRRRDARHAFPEVDLQVATDPLYLSILKGLCGSETQSRLITEVYSLYLL